MASTVTVPTNRLLGIITAMMFVSAIITAFLASGISPGGADHAVAGFGVLAFVMNVYAAVRD